MDVTQAVGASYTPAVSTAAAPGPGTSAAPVLCSCWRPDAAEAAGVQDDTEVSCENNMFDQANPLIGMCQDGGEEPAEN